MLQRSLAQVCGLVLAGCSASLGAAGSYAVQPTRYPSIGIQSGSLLELPLLVGENTRWAVGVETAVLARTDQSDQWGQWRLRPLLGLTDMPRTHQSFVGSEVFVVPGVARYYAHGRPLIAFAPGVQLGLPLRLNAEQPPWRSDDLVAIRGYLVPSIGLTSLGPTLGAREQLELTAGVSLRVQLWSAMLP